MATQVKFMVDRDESHVYAYFPRIKWDLKGNKTSFAINEGHGPVCDEYIKESRPAKPHEYADTLRCLVNGYGYELRISKANK